MQTKSLKRLQEGPTKTSQKLSVQKQTGRALQRLIGDLLQIHPEARTNQERKKCPRKKEMEMQASFEECVGLLDSLKVEEGRDDLQSRLGGLPVKTREQIAAEEDMSYWEDLGALDEEDFQEGAASMKELEEAEGLLLKDYDSLNMTYSLMMMETPVNKKSQEDEA